MEPIAKRRWGQAQIAEAEYWSQTRASAAEFARIISEKALAVEWSLANVPQLGRLRGHFLEVGVGPMGIGCIHLFPANAASFLVGLDPLPVTDGAARLPAPFQALIRACSQNYQQIQSRGEEAPLHDGQFTLAACYNVLEHCQDPQGVLREIHRVLRPGGYLLLGCDAFSLLGRAKYLLYVKKVLANSGEVLAHPFRFSATQLYEMVASDGFEILAVNWRRFEGVHRLIGRCYRLLIVGRKAMQAPQT